MKKFKLDRTAFKMGKQENAEPPGKYWKTKTPMERLAAAMYLNSIAYNYDIDNPPKMDRTVFSMRKHKA